MRPTNNDVRSRAKSLLNRSGDRADLAVAGASAVLDLLIIVGVLLISIKLRQNLPFPGYARDVQTIVLRSAAFIVITWLLTLILSGAYRKHIFGAGTEEYKLVVNASLLTAGLIGIGCYLAKIPLSRGFFIFTFLLGIPLLVLARLILRRGLHLLRRQGWLNHRVLIAGSSGQVAELAAVMQRERWLGYEIIGAVGDPASVHSSAAATGIKYLGLSTQAAEIALANQVDTLIISADAYPTASDLKQIQWDLEEHHVQVIISPNVTDIAAERVAIRPMAGLPLMILDKPQGLRALNRAKRFFDLIGGCAALIGLSPLIIFAAAAIKIHDGGPVLFRQTRVGRDGHKFQILKFRTMVADAETQLSELNHKNESDADGVLFKIAADPRVTKPGQWLRRFSVDELPQLINVIKGEMSLVGPRPALPAEATKYDEQVRRRLRVRPGMTGLWQVSGRSDLPWQETVRLDLYYVDNWSMVQDLNIMIKTIRAVLSSNGAY